MTMAVDSSQNRFSLGYNSMHSYSHHHAAPHFTNPWTAAPSGNASGQQSAGSPGMYGNMQQSLSGMESLRPHRQLPQPMPEQQQQQQQHQQHHQHHQQHHQHQHQHQHHSPQHHQASPDTHHHQHHQQQVQQHLPRPSPQQQQLPPAPMHRPSSTMSYGAGGMTVTAAPQTASPHSRPTMAADPSGYRSADLLSAAIATTSGSYVDSGAAATAYATSAAPYDQIGYTPAINVRSQTAAAAAAFGVQGLDASAAADAVRRFSQPDNGQVQGQESRRGFQDAIEASHGILSLSQDTPRPLAFGGSSSNPNAAPRSARGSGDSYGFPVAHSTSSSVSSSSFNGFYAPGSSIDSNMTDYSTAGSDMDSATGTARSHRHMSTGLPGSLSGGMQVPQQHQNPHSRPQAYGGSVPPPPAQSMMGQFSSKITNTAQKKHKCKVCEKRFTRPSSLQTHIYSHTGEKPFTCDVPGCGRNFSVVSNLRRHKKVHKDLAPSEAGSDDQNNSPL